MTRSERKSRRKRKPKAVAEKEEHPVNSVFHSYNFNECSWQMKSKATSPKEICWGPTIYCSKQNKTN
jgi:hypothetical protein